jgi:hypothetical protein
MKGRKEAFTFQVQTHGKNEGIKYLFIYLFIYFACMLFFSPSTATHSEDIYILRG